MGPEEISNEDSNFSFEERYSVERVYSTAGFEYRSLIDFLKTGLVKESIFAVREVKKYARRNGTWNLLAKWY